MTKFIFSEYHRKNKEQKGGFSVIRQGKIYFLTDTGRIAKRYVAERLSIQPKGIFSSPVKDKVAHQTISDDPHPGFLSTFKVSNADYILYAQAGDLLNFDFPLEDLNQARIIALQLCATVHHLHELNLGHFDLKPQNIVLRDNGTIALIDFDGALRLDNVSDVTISLPYAPPEIIASILGREGGESYDPRAHDPWSIGMSLATILQPDILKKSILPHMKKIENSIYLNENGLFAGIKQLVQAVAKQDQNMADLLSNLLDEDPQRRVAFFKQYKNHPLFSGLNKDAFQNKLVQYPEPPITKDDNYQDLKGYLKTVREELAQMKKNKMTFSKQDKYRYTVLKHYRNQTILSLAQIETHHPELRQYSALDRFALEFCNIPTVTQWRRTTDASRKYANQDISKAYDAIGEFLSLYEKKENAENRLDMMKDLQNFLDKSGFMDQNILDLSLKLQFKIELDPFKNDRSAKKNASSMPSPDQWKKMSSGHLFTIRGSTMKELDDLLEQFHDPTKPQRAVAQQIYQKCHEYILAHKNDDTLYPTARNLLQRTQYFLQTARIPTFSEWSDATPKDLKYTSPQSINDIEFLLMNFHEKNADKNKIATKIIRKCNQFLDENPIENPFTENVSILLQHGIYYLDNQQTLQAYQEVRETFSTKLGLSN